MKYSNNQEARSLLCESIDGSIVKVAVAFDGLSLVLYWPWKPIVIARNKDSKNPVLVMNRVVICLAERGLSIFEGEGELKHWLAKGVQNAKDK